MSKTDFSKLTPCGGDCEQCGLFYDGGCNGCRETGGKRIGNECAIFNCCLEHNVLFCGICWEFPCEMINSKLSEWDKDGIKKLDYLEREYRLLQKKRKK